MSSESVGLGFGAWKLRFLKTPISGFVSLMITLLKGIKS